jgi:hypothetical protein
MKKSLTGAGSLSRKLTAILLSTVMLIAVAADNSIYIDQAGDNATVSVNQDGSGNAVRGLPGAGTSNATPATIYGDGNQVSVSQIGSGNTLKLGINTNAAVGQSTVNYTTTGMNSNATIQVGSTQTPSSANIINVTQTGNGSTANVRSIGAGNTGTINTAGGANNSVTLGMQGDNITGSATVTGGGGNTIALDLQSPGGTATVTAAGATNSVNVLQTGGVVGHQTTVELTGSGNTVGIQQQGTAGDNVINLRSSGSSGTFTINQNNH